MSHINNLSYTFEKTLTKQEQEQADSRTEWRDNEDHVEINEIKIKKKPNTINQWNVQTIFKRNYQNWQAFSHPDRNGCINKIRDTKGRHYNRYGRKGLIMTNVLSMLLRRKE